MTSRVPADRRRIRVLTLVDGATGLGGAETLAVMVTKQLNPQRFDRVLCATRGDLAPHIVSELESAGVELVRLRRTSPLAIWAWWPLISLIRREGIDVIHAHKFGSNVWATLLGGALRIPVVIAHEHSWGYDGDRLRILLDRELIARRASAFLAVSAEDRHRMFAVEGIEPDKVRLMPNGIPDQPLGDGRTVRQELGIPERAPVIGSVGGLRPPKAYDVLIKATALLAAEFPQIRTVIAGRGTEESSLRALIAQQNLGARVELLGARRDVPNILAALDVAVSSSVSEGSPLAVMEYMAAGTAIVATRVGGVPDLITDRVHGLLVEPRDVQGLADAVAELLRDTELRAALAAKARERQQREFTLAALVDRLELLYEELLRSRSSSARKRRVARSCRF
jgi:glycosyltransferase involved in cell wall biosynthesis